MQKKLVIFVGVGIVLAFVALYHNLQKSRISLIESNQVHYHTGFLVYIDGVKQDFSNDTYMNPDICGVKLGNKVNPLDKVHLHGNVGDVAHIHSDGVVWRDLFSNLNLNFAAQAQVPGYRNGQRIENILNFPILPNDSVIVIIGNEQGINLSQYVSQEHIREVEGQLEKACGESH